MEESRSIAQKVVGQSETRQTKKCVSIAGIYLQLTKGTKFIARLSVGMLIILIELAEMLQLGRERMRAIRQSISGFVPILANPSCAGFVEQKGKE